MTEQGDFVYEWFYDEEQEQYNCVGQVFLLSVMFSETENQYVGVLWDIEPVDPLWNNEEESSVVSAMAFDNVHDALDWCEIKDIQEAEFDAGSFGSSN